MNEAYQKQVRLLLDVLPEVAKEDCFALHGGTAINLFVRNMPRLSVDIDLTYVHIAERNETLLAINAALTRIAQRAEKLRPSMRVQHNQDVCKLQIDDGGALIKVEVNTVARGLIGDSQLLSLCERAQAEFDVFVQMPVVSLAQLYGGKLCAALDRQHPRDLFDVKLLLENEGITDDLKRGFLFALVSSNRPTHEMLAPNLLDQKTVFDNQFSGMTDHTFDYADFEAVRLQMLSGLNAILNASDKAFLLSINQLAPDWSIFPWQDFPSVKWKLFNLAKFKESKADVYHHQVSVLAKLLVLDT
jgi:predicted nucleotidyltransferase component of viral defense system